MTAPALTLVNATYELLSAAIDDADELGRLLGAAITDGWADFPEALPTVRALYAEHPEGIAWGTLFFVEENPRALVGWGGYKGRPSAEGALEIGYAVAPSRRGRGLATEAIQQMVERAFADPSVEFVDAHTLAHESASTRVLEKVGFSLAGEATDPDDGAVWHFRVSRARARLARA